MIRSRRGDANVGADFGTVEGARVGVGGVVEDVDGLVVSRLATTIDMTNGMLIIANNHFSQVGKPRRGPETGVGAPATAPQYAQNFIPSGITFLQRGHFIVILKKPLVF